MLEIEIGANVYTTSRPGVAATYLGMLLDDRDNPVAARVLFADDGESYVGAASLFATEQEARAAVERMLAAWGDDSADTNAATNTIALKQAAAQQPKQAARRTQRVE